MISRLGGMYGDCIGTGEPQLNRNVYESMFRVNYSSSVSERRAPAITTELRLNHDF